MDDAHPDIVDACSAPPHAPVGRIGDVGNAAADVSALIQSVIRAGIVPKVGVLLDELISAAKNAEVAADDLAKILSAVEHDLEAAVAWLKAQFSPPAPAKLGIFHRGDDLATALQQHATSTAQSLAKILANQQTELTVLGHETQVLDALSSAVTTLLGEPGLTINPTLIQGQVSRLKAATEALAAVLAKNPLPKS